MVASAFLTKHAGQRFLHCSALRTVRLRKTISLQPPIEPTVANIEVPDDHPLWQFFADRKYLRRPDELDDTGRSWTVQELRKKSFEDLHQLWYVCLKERNAVAREHRLIMKEMKSEYHVNSHEQYDERIKKTMDHIRHVLSERYHGWENARKQFDTEKESLIEKFRNSYVNGDREKHDELGDQLERFQYALFGIDSEDLGSNEVTLTFVEGLKIGSQLKFDRFKQFIDTAGVEDLRDVSEHFIIFSAEHSEEAVAEACQAIVAYRKEGTVVSPKKEVLAVKGFIKSQLEQPAESQEAKEGVEAKEAEEGEKAKEGSKDSKSETSA